jgi:uncharacterized protein YdeI (YjbR/CyaY-like superfamily)
MINSTQWPAELDLLRQIARDCGLTEATKWGKPCFMFEGTNVLVVAGFKDYCALILFKGGLMKDPKGILVQPTENTHAGRQIRFGGLAEILKLKTVLKSYIREAIAVEKSGVKQARVKHAELKYPEEFQVKLDKMPALKKAFAALTPGRQRAYYLHFSGAKQSATRAARVDKCISHILEGKGIGDQ